MVEYSNEYKLGHFLQDILSGNSFILITIKGEIDLRNDAIGLTTNMSKEEVIILIKYMAENMTFTDVTKFVKHTRVDGQKDN